MLVLSRRENERIKLGDSITVTIVRVTGDKVRLGIDAPPNVLVLREELEVDQPAGLAGTHPEPAPAPVACTRVAGAAPST